MTGEDKIMSRKIESIFNRYQVFIREELQLKVHEVYDFTNYRQPDLLNSMIKASLIYLTNHSKKAKLHQES